MSEGTLVGGFGGEIHDAIDAINAVQPTWHLIGFVEDAPNEENRRLVERRGSQVLGNLTEVHASVRDHLKVKRLVALPGGVGGAAEITPATHTTALQKMSIGASATVGAGSRVVQSAADTTMKGVPAI